MKLKDIEVGQSYLRRRGRGYSDQIVYVIGKGWKRNDRWNSSRRFVPNGTGVGVAVAAGLPGVWRPDVVPPAQIIKPMTEEQLLAQQAALVASMQENRERAAQQEAEVDAAVARLVALGIPAYKNGYGQGSVVSIRHSGLAQLEALVQRSVEVSATLKT